ncbi:hypothetical protein BGZ96_000916 [Linnemannia gamsii]|uniref:Uncharacterized protein n=1 Tax=Linnemannia gamsii TaxID=64522 RepID=A0ABQ7KAE3_9FUNG|nr:hypothetical protein BGZ96_000916 [Linnemannia gamsii]
MNHLQGGTISSESNNSIERESRSRSVLIVTISRTTLQESMRRERQICKELYPSAPSSSSSSSCSSSDKKSDMHPWAHLWPPPHPPTPDEYRTETPSSSPTITPPIPSKSKEPTTLFRADLWARIQIRYAPTIRHVESLFRCLHLNPGSTQGKTFGGGGGDAHESVVPSSCVIAEEDVGGVVTPPTLVILLSCFGQDRSSEIRRFSMMDIVPAFADRQTFDETKYVVNKDQKGESVSCASQTGTGRRSSGAGGRVGTLDDEGGEGEELDSEELEELEYSEYIRMVANTMAEIKDSLAWLERSSGQMPELLIVEETGQDYTNPSQLLASSRSTTTQQQQEMMMPTVRELWLQTVMGFWVDAFIKTEPPLSSLIQQQQHQQRQEPRRESYRLWIRTQESLSAAFTTTATTMLQSTWVDKGRSFHASTDAAAASMGAVLGVQWHFDSTGDRVYFEVVS